MSYVDGFLLPIPKRKLALYRKIARAAGKVWMDHGALEYLECAGDDLRIHGTALFGKAVRAKKDETVFFSYIVYRSKAHRNSVNRKVMTDLRLQRMMQPGAMPFDMKRMCYGGFKAVVELRAKRKKKR
jgi:uncharacterized protein YbaA (DUF1428 family)